MGFRYRVDNIPIKDELLIKMKNTLDINIKKGIKIRKNRPIYMLEGRGRKKFRLDIHKGWPSWLHFKFMYQKTLHDKGVNVARPIRFIKLATKVSYQTWILSEWIEGVRLDEVWHVEEVFEKLGEQVAKINSTKLSDTNLCGALFDFSRLNGIWTPDEEVYIIDLSVKPYENINYSVYKTLTTSLRTKSRIDAFLKGYSKIKSTEKLIEYAKSRKWKWKGISLAKNGELKNREKYINDVINCLRGIINAQNTN